MNENINAIISFEHITAFYDGEKEVILSKFKIETNQYLLAYRFFGENLELIMIGPHENYYRDLKKRPSSPHNFS